MEHARWQRIKEVLDEALERPPEERAARVEAVCAEDAALRREVMALLEGYPEASRLFGEMQASAGAVLPEAAEREGSRVGAYRLVEEIGRGGMGAVYRAERADDAFEQEVAVKLLGYEFDREALRRRFLSERQILASLHHPGIAALHDGGVTEDGRPYFVMELVEGTPIDQYCDAKRLSIAERLRLFEQVAEAVQHAHQRLVIHRDLKPSNILVTEDGRVKLLDFGIAKLLDADAAEAAAGGAPTRTGQHLMTPEYAAPEQVTGAPITTATDVYQLGILLYELLTGHRPYRADRRAPYEVIQAICEEEPTRPSTIVTQVRAARRGEGLTRLTPEAVARARQVEARRLRQMLRGDLDAIILKALRKEPDRRYRTVEALRADLRAYRSEVPVGARSGVWTYRTGKFIRRHRWGAVVAAVFLVFLFGYAATITLQARHIARQHDRAEQVAGFLTGLLEMSDPHKGSGRTVTAEGILDVGARQLSTELADQPAVRVSLMNVIGSAYRNLGLYEKALAQHEQALAVSTRHFGPASREAADTQNNLGEVLYYLGRYEEASASYLRSLETRRRLLGDEHIDIAQSLNNLALIDWVLGRYASAKSRLRKAAAIFEDQLGEHWRTANARNNLARVLSTQGDYDAAASLYRRALAMHQRLSGERRNDVALAVTRNNFGVVLREQGKLEAAEQAHRQALVGFRRLLKSDHPFIGMALLRLAEVLHRQGRGAEAGPAYQEALAHQRRVLSAGDPRLADPMISWGTFLSESGRAAEAEPLLRKARRLLQQTLPAGHWQIAAAQSAHGASLTALGRYREAEPLLVESLEILKAQRGLYDRHTREAHARLAALYDAWNKPQQAAPYRALLAEGDAAASISR